LGDDRLVVAASIGEPSGDRRADLESESAADFGNHPLGVRAFGRISGKGDRERGRLGKLKQVRSPAKSARNRDDSALGGSRLEQKNNTSSDFLAGGLDPDQAFYAEQAHRSRFVGENRRIRFHRTASDPRLGRYKGFKESCPEGTRLRLIGSMEQVEANVGAGLIDQP